MNYEMNKQIFELKQTNKNLKESSKHHREIIENQMLLSKQEVATQIEQIRKLRDAEINALIKLMNEDMKLKNE